MIKKDHAKAKRLHGFKFCAITSFSNHCTKFKQMKKYILLVPLLLDLVISGAQTQWKVNTQEEWEAIASTSKDFEIKELDRRYCGIEPEKSH